MTAVDIFHRILGFHLNSVPDRQTEWKLLRTAWLTRPHQFEVSAIHSSPSDHRNRITVAYFPEYSDRNHYCLYHVYLSTVRRGQVTHIEGAGTGRTSYLIFREKGGCYYTTTAGFTSGPFGVVFSMSRDTEPARPQHSERILLRLTAATTVPMIIMTNDM
jgi:hypothetical protein